MRWMDGVLIACRNLLQPLRNQPESRQRLTLTKPRLIRQRTQTLVESTAVRWPDCHFGTIHRGGGAERGQFVQLIDHGQPGDDEPMGIPINTVCSNIGYIWYKIPTSHDCARHLLLQAGRLAANWTITKHSHINVAIRAAGPVVHCANSRQVLLLFLVSSADRNDCLEIPTFSVLTR
ncbi:hypothetical protein VFPPC_15063 [Pochonia chlamydosporia 170]|uniref:Uncharacterized protein n=1 Tax=Pochonia chlamydosporia 170 TaxID=1380566 RepID=A0A179G2J0_METCM|nr:hypothetical protein VFPPC_15063 [Pochonia chlamydosporia 170]OAQ72074.1 hypothetical protein VFPPC_15063 [Pochonia chlamydosporia 170]